jgi:methylated-DNA-[protein]-cysteine S-methyltransferase
MACAECHEGPAAADSIRETISYAALARCIAQLLASRAVGHASARSPISIIVPCHRVIGADNALTGYPGGLERKRMLLANKAGKRPARGVSARLFG